MSESEQHAQPDPNLAAPRFSLDTGSPWDRAPSWQELRSLYNGKKITAIRDASFRARLIGEADVVAPIADLTQLMPIVDGQPAGSVAADSLAAEAVRRGISPAAAYLEMVLESGGSLTFGYPWSTTGTTPS
jgi:hypothetical protein